MVCNKLVLLASWALLVVSSGCLADKPSGFHSHPLIPASKKQCNSSNPIYPGEKSCEEIGQEQQAANSGRFKPRYVCSATCVCYANRGDLQQFISNRCCTFIPCPGSSQVALGQYEIYKQEHCPSNTKPPGTGGIKPAPKQTCEEVGREQQAAQSNASLLIGVSSKFVCSPTCVCYADRGDLQSFNSNRCCNFIPCPGSSQESLQTYESYKAKHCPSNLASRSASPAVTSSTSSSDQESCETLGEKQQSANSGKFGLFREDFVCSPTCVCYANRGDAESFRSNNCCRLIPCPGSSQVALDQYGTYRDQQCASEDAEGSTEESRGVDEQEEKEE